MRKEFLPYKSWVGTWVGGGETLKSVPAEVTLQIEPQLDGLVLCFIVQAREPGTGRLIHGVVSHLTVDPDGWLRLGVTSTLHGSMIMPVTPEDPGALAVEGRSITGNHVVVSLVQEGDGLMLTSYWRAPTPGAEPIGFSNYRLVRAEALKVQGKAKKAQKKR
ncbi:MAG: hypothetical protein HS108_01230 [Planctomycetes bacterium]|jgi:hypothetical protein|nr:hypothetical protein [Planctomycetota bacterium]MCL4729729.1 hypothetical protein [Planctomycetota bacterium]